MTCNSIIPNILTTTTTRMQVPRPTLADVDLPPRRRLRDGSRSVRSSSSLSSVPNRVARVTRGVVVRSGRSGSIVSNLSTTTSSLSGSSLSSAPISRAQSIRAQSPVNEINDYAMNGDDHDHSGVVNDQDGPRTRIDHGSTLIDLINNGDDEEEGEVEESLANRQSRSRYTAAEKGKGRARTTGAGGAETIIVDDDDDEEEEGSFQVTGIKRKVYELEDDDDNDEEEEEGEDTRLGAYTCPICFSEPTNGVMTSCGHILCSKCLFSCLLAAIARNPNPHPSQQPRPKPKQKKSKRKSGSKRREPQPIEWTAETLSETWKYYKDAEYESIAREAGLDETDIQAGRDEGEIGVEMVLKGLWRVDGELVVEGECPVCRKGLPGGYGPPGRRIGSVMPVIASIGGG